MEPTQEHCLNLFKALSLPSADRDTKAEHLSNAKGWYVSSGIAQAIKSLYADFVAQYPEGANHSGFIYLYGLWKEYFWAFEGQEDTLFEVTAGLVREDPTVNTKYINSNARFFVDAIATESLHLVTVQHLEWLRVPGQLVEFLAQFKHRRTQGKVLPVETPLRPRGAHAIRRYFPHSDLGVRYTHAAPDARLVLSCLTDETAPSQKLRALFASLDDQTSVYAFKVIDAVTTAVDSAAATRPLKYLENLQEAAGAAGVEFGPYLEVYSAALNLELREPGMKATVHSGLQGAHEAAIAKAQSEISEIAAAAEHYELHWSLRDEHKMDYDAPANYWAAKTAYSLEEITAFQSANMKAADVVYHAEAGYKVPAGIFALCEAGVSGQVSLDYLMDAGIRTAAEVIQLRQAKVGVSVAAEYARSRAYTDSAERILLFHSAGISPENVSKLAGGWVRMDTEVSDDEIISRWKAVQGNKGINVVGRVVENALKFGGFGQRLLEVHAVPRSTVDLIRKNQDALLFTQALDQQALDKVVDAFEQQTKISLREFWPPIKRHGSFTECGFADFDEVQAARRQLEEAQRLDPEIWEHWSETRREFLTLDPDSMDAALKGHIAPRKTLEVLKSSPEILERFIAADEGVRRGVVVLVEEETRQVTPEMFVNYMEIFDGQPTAA